MIIIIIYICLWDGWLGVKHQITYLLVYEKITKQQTNRKQSKKDLHLWQRIMVIFTQ